MCGHLLVTNRENAVMVALEAGNGVQHRGDNAAAIAYQYETPKGRRIRRVISEGLVAGLARQVNSTEAEAATSALLHCRYRTRGSKHPRTNRRDSQPLVSTNGRLAIAVNGEVPDADKVREKLTKSDVRFTTGNDSEILLRLLEGAEGSSIPSKMMSALPKLPGAFSMTLLWDDYAIGVSDRGGTQPLCFGQLPGGGHIFASEDFAIRTVGGTPVHDFGPGEMIIVGPNSNVQRYQWAERGPCHHCSFNYIYSAAPGSMMWGNSISKVRRAFGDQEFAEMCESSVSILDRITLMVGVLDSGRPATHRFAQQFAKRRIVRMIESGEAHLIRNIDAGELFPEDSGVDRSRYHSIRSFLLAENEKRHALARLKHLVNPEIVRNQVIGLGEDSLIRGNTLRALIAQLYEWGAAEVHVLVFSPRVTHECHYGSMDTHRTDLIASRITTDAGIAQYIGADSVHFLSLDGFKKVLTSFGGGFCTACMDGNYPIPVPKRRSVS